MSDPIEDEKRLREATRLAHEALQALKEERKEVERLLVSWKSELEKVMQDYVRAELVDMGEQIARQTEKGKKLVIDKFDFLYNTLMGQDKQSQRQGKPSIPELLQARATVEKFRSHE